MIQQGRWKGSIYYLIPDSNQITIVVDKEMEVRCFHVHLSSNYDSTRRIRDRIQIVLLTDKEMEVRYSLVDSSSNLGFNYDSTRRRKGSIYYLLSDSNQITIVVDKYMEVRYSLVYLSYNYDSQGREYLSDLLLFCITQNNIYFFSYAFTVQFVVQICDIMFNIGDAKQISDTYSHVDSSSNLSSNYDSTRRMRDRIQITIVVDKYMEGRFQF